MEFKDLINESNLDFSDISTEAVRKYHYSGGEEEVINHPVALNVSKSGGHRLVDAFGVSHYIPKGWRRISWIPKEGKPHFIK